MTFISYAQNFEDVILWRALGDVEGGRYLDIGAQDPVQDSVSLAFYNAGWRGVHVEPTPAYAALLREARPDETVIQAAVTDADGPLNLFEFPLTGLSTGDSDIARRHVELGFQQRPVVVPTVRLDHLLDLAGDELHWLKIDVEGMEVEVLRSWGDHPRRPWIVVIEATSPNTQVPTHARWLGEVTRRGYKQAYFDGLSRYFVHIDHIDLKKRLTTPPNVFDGFQLTAGHVGVRQIVSDAQREQEAGLAALDEARSGLDQLRGEIAGLAAAKQVAEAEAAELPELKAVAKAAEAGRVAAIEALATATDAHARAVDTLWRERNEHEHSLRQIWSAREAELIDGRTEQDRANRAKIEALQGELGERSRDLAAAAAELRLAEVRLSAELERLAEAQRSRDLLETALSSTRAELAEAVKERDQLDADIATAQLEIANIKHFFDGALEQPPGLWHRLGRVLGVAEDDPARRALATWRADRSAFHPATTGSTIQSFNMSDSGNPYLRADSLGELLSWHEVDFVRCAYVTILGRQPDPDGEAYYTDRLKRGHSKMEVLWQLRRSSEGKTHDPGIAGLDHALKEAAWERRRYTGWIIRLLASVGRDLKAYGHFRASGRKVRGILGLGAGEIGVPPAPPVSGVPPRTGPDAGVTLRETPPTPEVRTTYERSRGQAATHLLHDVPTTRTSDAARTSGIAYSVGHTCKCPVNTGVQRVARQLARALIGNRKPLVFVKWNDDECQFELLNRTELEHIAEWAGPPIHEIFGLDQYPIDGADPVFLKEVDWLTFQWMFFPEIHHLGTEDHEITISQINAARALNLRTAAIFYDAIPLRRTELGDVRALHESYMRQLMGVDVAFPISNTAASDLTLFLQSYEGVEGQRMPVIQPVLLPAEMPEESRRATKREHSQTVLCVGSIDEHKNQLLLAQSFAELSLNGQVDGWKLQLVGNCNPDLYPRLSGIIQGCPAIEWLGPVSDEALSTLYEDVAFCVFPSIDEGFGLPIAESLWMGKPCLCANYGSMAEIAAVGGCLTVDTSDFASLMQGLRELMQNGTALERLQDQVASAELRTWSVYAAELLSYLDKASEGAELHGPIDYVVEQTSE